MYTIHHTPYIMRHAPNGLSLQLCIQKYVLSHNHTKCSIHKFAIYKISCATFFYPKKSFKWAKHTWGIHLKCSCICISVASLEKCNAEKLNHPCLILELVYKGVHILN